MALDTNTKLLLHCDYGVDGTSIIDSSPSDHTCTPVGTAHIVTTPDKYGAASWYRGALALDGDSDYVTIPDSADFHFGSGNFTVDTWVNSSASTGEIASQFISSSEYWMVSIVSNGVIEMVFRTGDAYTGFYYTGSTSVLDGNWHHIAFVRSGNNGYIFLDGTSLSVTALAAFTGDVGTIAAPLHIGENNTSYLNGYIDELRISKGVARWTSNFTPYCGLTQGKAYGHSPTPCFRMTQLGAGTV